MCFIREVPALEGLMLKFNGVDSNTFIFLFTKSRNPSRVPAFLFGFQLLTKYSDLFLKLIQQFQAYLFGLAHLLDRLYDASH